MIQILALLDMLICVVMIYQGLILLDLSRNNTLRLGCLIIVCGNAWAASWAFTAYEVGYRSLEIYAVAALGHFGWLLTLKEYLKDKSRLNNIDK